MARNRIPSARNRYAARAARAERVRGMLRSPLGLVSLLALVAAIVAGILLSNGGKPREPRLFEAVGFRQLPVYHSPQTPGLTEFVGAWIMPDGSLMTEFTQATGPLSGRARTPRPLQRLLLKQGYPPDPNDPALIDPKWDFWGLKLSAVFLRSTDGGATWRRWRTDRYQATYPHPYAGSSIVALRDGSILRVVNGFDLLGEKGVPHTAFIQRLAPGARSWSRPQVLLDPSRYVYQLSRIRRLRDGRLIALGNDYRHPAPTDAQIAAGSFDPKRMQAAARDRILLVSADEGRSWRSAVTISPAARIAPDEWDAAELPDGDLLAVLRAPDPSKPGGNLRWQAVLEKKGDGWEMSKVRRAPLPPSGHPELLAARGGPVLYLSTEGIWYTDDAGDTWRRLPGSERTAYYPRSVQAADGTIYVLSHQGGDYWYGEGDEAINLERFRLREIPRGPRQAPAR